MQVIRWLQDQSPACPYVTKPQSLHLDILKDMASAASLEECQHVLIPAACHAAMHKDQELIKWAASLEPVFTLQIVRQLLLWGWVDGVKYMHDLGCLDFDSADLQDELEIHLVWPAMMGNFVSIKVLKEVLIAEGAVQSSICIACAGRIVSLVGRRCTDSSCSIGRVAQAAQNFWH